MLGSSFLKSETPNIGWRSVTSSTTFLLSGLGMIDIASGKHSGGLLGEILSTPFVALFDTYASIIFLGAILIISILVMFDAKLDLVPFFQKIWTLITRKKITTENTPEVEIEEEEDEEKIKESASSKIKKALGIKKEETEEEEEMQIKKRRGGIISTYTPPPLSLLEEDQGKPNTGDNKAKANNKKPPLLNFGI